jgi:cephalosporin-C deacetylase-like acetyl esterase
MMRTILFFVLLTLGVSTQAENYPYRADCLWLTVPDHADWLYKTGEKAKVEVSLYRYGVPQDVEVTYEIGPDMMPATASGKVMLKGGRAVIDMGTMKTPGFLDLRLKVILNDHKYEHHVKIGFSPENLKPYTKNPADFDSFWQKAIEKARKEVSGEKLQVSSKKVDDYCTDETDMYLLKLHTDQHHSIYGYLSVPKGVLQSMEASPTTGQECSMANGQCSMVNGQCSMVNGQCSMVNGQCSMFNGQCSMANGQCSIKKYPIVLCPPGAGVKTIKEPMRNLYYAKNGFIRLEMEIHGLNPEMTAEQFKEMSSAFDRENGYLCNGLDDKDNYYMKHVYVACVRALDYLCSLPQWDGKNVFVQGGSQGGALSLITAALDPRVTACVANHPALSDMAGYLDNRAGGYPHFNKLNNMLTPAKVETLAYYDVVNFARRIQCPVYMTWGYNDNTCPPTTSYIVWNLITAPKESLVTPINEHWTSEATNYGQMLWLKKQIK